MRSVFGKLIFARSMPFVVQKIAQRVVRGPRLETVRFQGGQRFDCFTTEKYYWLRELYEEDERRELERCIRPDSVLFDVGAHVGFWEVLLAPKCRHIYAFEPSPHNFARLSRNVSQNALQNVTLVDAAASDKTTCLHIVEDGSMSYLNESGLPVGAIELDDYISEHVPPSIVKIDIEGYGAAALRGMRRSLAQHRPILFIELHNTDEVTGCRSILDGFGYQVSALGSDRRFPYRAKFIPA